MPIMAHVAQDAKRKEEKRQRMPREVANLCVDFLMCLRLWSRTHRKKKAPEILLLLSPRQNKLWSYLHCLCAGISVFS